jgi:hypothetical protein
VVVVVVPRGSDRGFQVQELPPDLEESEYEYYSFIKLWVHESNYIPTITLVSTCVEAPLHILADLGPESAVFPHVYTLILISFWKDAFISSSVSSQERTRRYWGGDMGWIFWVEQHHPFHSKPVHDRRDLPSHTLRKPKMNPPT